MSTTRADGPGGMWVSLNVKLYIYHRHENFPVNGCLFSGASPACPSASPASLAATASRPPAVLASPPSARRPHGYLRRRRRRRVGLLGGGTLEGALHLGETGPLSQGV
jgi:hypothetical protein